MRNGLKLLSESSLTQPTIGTDAPSSPVRIYDARSGYDLVAESYDSSPWRRFWKENEFPILKKILLKYLGSYSPQTYIDVGCGTGYLLSQFGKYFTSFCGLDISPKMAAIAQKKVGSESVLVVDALDYSGPDNCYDVATATRVMSHVENPLKFVKKIFRLCSPQALCVISDIHPEHSYGYTRMEIGREQISIETYKHKIAIILQSLETVGFTEIYVREYFRQNLFRVEKYGLRSLNSTSSPIFYIIVAKKGESLRPNMRAYLKKGLGFTRFGPIIAA